MAKPEADVVTINGKPVKLDDLTPEQMYFMRQLQDLQGKIETLRFQLDQVEVAHRTFSTALNQTVQTQETPDGSAASTET